MSSYFSSGEDSHYEQSFTGECNPCNDNSHYDDESYSSYHDDSLGSSHEYSVHDDSSVHESELPEVKDTYKKKSKKMVNVVYHHITFGKRSAPHNSDILTGGGCILIDGIDAPRLVIRPGNTYIFRINQVGDDHTFILTTNRVGKNNHGIPVLPINGAPEAMSHGDYVYRATSNTPISFYYNSTKDTWYGNVVVCTPKLL
jgi:hypothetical protein